MKYGLLALLILSLSGCSWLCPKQDKEMVPVWTPPKFDMPARPVLRSINNSKLDPSVKTDIESKNVQADMNDLGSYATQLESVITTISTYKPASAVLPTDTIGK